MNIGNEFLTSVIKRFTEYKILGEKTLSQLRDEELFYQPNESSNSIAIIIQHLHGNMLSRWINFLSEDGEKESRKRDEEFEPQPLSRQELEAKWNEGWNILLTTLHSLTSEDLLKTITIRHQPLLALDAISRQLAHYSYHVGQIVFLGKWLKNKDWQTLSIPKGASRSVNEQMKQRYT
ncbi:MAG: DUF1572 family protein [Flavisolibacter sp.]|nr:DUF1572 family protein [Flavisolibacter sp.]MBD0350975.1 DUF1572 family protein [Flavisolibacter sp.]MBD0374943.1 DUF1572 family protein [Flavisolibacter sp.]